MFSIKQQGEEDMNDEEGMKEGDRVGTEIELSGGIGIVKVVRLPNAIKMLLQNNRVFVPDHPS